MKRNSAKSLTKRRSVQRRTSAADKLKGSSKKRSSTELKVQRIARGRQALKELFAIGERTFKRLDTETIVRAAEDKDLEYL